MILPAFRNNAFEAPEPVTLKETTEAFCGCGAPGKLGVAAIVPFAVVYEVHPVRPD